MLTGGRIQPSNYRRGQAMVEFAILVLLVTLLIAGGIELGLAAFASQRASNGAENGVGAWIAALEGAGVYDDSIGPDFSIPSGNGLGDHSASFVRPACDADPSVYDDGLPVDSVTRPGGDKFYLFNPRPIDITLCTGQDGTNPNRSRISVLVDRLPEVNRAMYGLYQKRCADALGAEIPCSDAGNVAQTYLRLPGKLDEIDDRVYLAILDSDPDSPTFQQPLGPSRPTFDIECAEAASDLFADCDTEIEPADVCFEIGTGDPLACDVRVRTRARFIFHALLQYPFVYWNDPLPVEALAQMDTGPAGSAPGVVGSEVARGNVRRFQRTFQGCWETLTVPPSGGMLGSRTARACN